MATRLQADADGKESKWADIDDDEDDWAPETIEWNDGTKIDLSQTNQAAILAEEQARLAVEKERAEEERKSRLAALQKTTTTVGPNATVLKPRSSAQPKSGGVVLKTSTDKPTLVAKPAAPAPVRSPWASLPPVEKVAPVEINPPSQPSTSRQQQTEPYANNVAAVPPPAPPPAMEIAADSFTRTRREDQNGNLGQLYNAQSGQYEPAHAGRRGSVRKDQNFRPPSVLQRGSQHDQQGAAEPSAAFQTRRGSSTVSGDSGPQGRRGSTSRGIDFSRIPNDLHQQRRESQPLVSPSTPNFRHDARLHSATQSPATQHAQIVQEARSATGSPYQSRNAANDPPPPYSSRDPATDGSQASQVDEIAAQKALMRERRELAIKRRKEEDEREEAAKRERIRIKMENLGMAPLEERKEKREPEKKHIEKRKSDEARTDEGKETEKSATRPTVSQVAPQPQKQPEEASHRTSSSPLKALAHESSTGHQQQAAVANSEARLRDKPSPSNELPVVDKPKTQIEGPKISPSGLGAKTEATEPLQSPLVNGITKHPDAPIYKAADTQNQTPNRDTRQQPWNNSLRDQTAYRGWNGQVLSREPSVSNSVWGPTSQSRTLGNGTFDRSVQRPQSRTQDQFTSPALAPIGPPRNLQRPRESADLLVNDTSSAPVAEDFQTIPTFPPSEAPHSSAIRSGLTSRPASAGRQTLSSQAEVGSHLRPQTYNVEPNGRVSDRQTTLNAWGTFQVNEAEKNRVLAQQNAARLADDARNGIQRPPPQLPVMNETWRQVKVDDQNSERHVVGVSRAQNTHDRSINAPRTIDTQSPPFVGPLSHAPIGVAGMGRASRFFPGANAGMQPQFHGPMRFAPGYRRSSSPPPPEDEFHYHPAFTREQTRPQVNLPFLNINSVTEDTKPKVRLPPSVVTPTESPQLSEVRALPFRTASQPLVNNPSWQDRFNGLLGVKKPTPEKNYVQMVDGFSATKVPLDSPPVRPSASVSLPPQSAESMSRVLESASKAVEDEEALFENREFGSLPAVVIPTKAPEVGWVDAKAPKRGQSKHSKLSKEVEAASKDILVEKDMLVNGNILIFVNLLGMTVNKSVPMPRTIASETAHTGPRPRNITANVNSAKGYKSRESSGTHGHNTKNNQAALSNGPPQSGPHQQSRQQGKSRPAWGPRTATAVH